MHGDAAILLLSAALHLLLWGINARPGRQGPAQRHQASRHWRRRAALPYHSQSTLSCHCVLRPALGKRPHLPPHGPHKQLAASNLRAERGDCARCAVQEV